ncbi:hypothetical protein SAMN05421538_101488 [Paracoccus isoporae]|uniref:Uncharacterized protein n=1 Tax=Paracoccus isoporae TaxID=591205 RepID=A0A1G6U8D5_9RHOB|nr:hypothetical protein [Paracoccus isoporae]SDD37618.1 hypothetical protein SAMN05421538_101488 [Paracoccus isoporae]
MRIATLLLLGGMLTTWPSGGPVASEMVTDRFYDVVVPGLARGRVAFLADGRVIGQRSTETELEQKGRWWRDDGLLCLEDEPGDKPVCVQELPHDDPRGFSLRYMIFRADLTPEG